jgi:hypothetical protein
MHRLIHNVSKNLSEHGEKLDATVKSEIQSSIDAAKALGDNADLEKVGIYICILYMYILMSNLPLHRTA